MGQLSSDISPKEEKFTILCADQHSWFCRCGSSNASSANCDRHERLRWLGSRFLRGMSSAVVVTVTTIMVTEARSVYAGLKALPPLLGALVVSKGRRDTATTNEPAGLGAAVA
jgi:hypothetical protein